MKRPSDYLLTMTQARAIASQSGPLTRAATERCQRCSPAHFGGPHPARLQTEVRPPGVTHGYLGGLGVPRSLPDPAAPGPLKVCAQEYSFEQLVFGTKISFMGKLFVPGVKIFNACVAGLKCPLVFISHADFSLGEMLHTDHTEYDALGQRLASHGAIVASISRWVRLNGGPLQQLENAQEWLVYSQQLWWLYHNSPVSNSLTDDMALIAHSGGGRSVHQHLETFTQTKNVRDLILLAPAGDTSLLKDIGAYLGVNFTHDIDFQAGGTVPNIPTRPSLAITYFDQLVDKTTPKDALFLGFLDHHAQNEPSLMAYLTAHLGLHLHDNMAYRDVFRLQQLPGSLSQPPYVLLSHAEKFGKRLADFTSNVPDVSGAGGISKLTIDVSWKLNLWATMDTRVLWFKWTKSFVITYLRLRWKPQSLQGFRWLAFRMCQCYDNSQGNTTGITREVQITLETTLRNIPIGKASVFFPATGKEGVPAARIKTVFATFALDLTEVPNGFKVGELVSGVRFDFGGNSTGSSIFMLGEIDAWI